MTILKQIHDVLDAAVLEAYGWGIWPRMDRIVAAGAIEEAPSRVPDGTDARRATLQASHAPIADVLARGAEASSTDSTLPAPSSPLAWPKPLSEQVAAIQKLLPATGPNAAPLAGHFGKRTKARVSQIEEILKTLGGFGKL